MKKLFGPQLFNDTYMGQTDLHIGTKAIAAQLVWSSNAWTDC